MTLTPYKSLTELEWLTVPDDQVTDYLKWHKEARPTPKPSLFEMIDLFQDELYDVAIDKLGASEDSARFGKLLHYLRNLKNGVKNPELQIEKAKAYPIDRLFNDLGHDLRYDMMTTCPVHEDKSPSCKVYITTNTWHCFGCGAGTDTIDLLVKGAKLTFIDAVKRLT